MNPFGHRSVPARRDRERRCDVLRPGPHPRQRNGLNELAAPAFIVAMVRPLAISISASVSGQASTSARQPLSMKAWFARETGRTHPRARHDRGCRTGPRRRPRTFSAASRSVAQRSCRLPAPRQRRQEPQSTRKKTARVRGCARPRPSPRRLREDRRSDLGNRRVAGLQVVFAPVHVDRHHKRRTRRWPHHGNHAARSMATRTAAVRDPPAGGSFALSNPSATAFAAIQPPADRVPVGTARRRATGFQAFRPLPLASSCRGHRPVSPG